MHLQELALENFQQGLVKVVFTCVRCCYTYQAMRMLDSFMSHPQMPYYAFYLTISFLSNRAPRALVAKTLPKHAGIGH